MMTRHKIDNTLGEKLNNLQYTQYVQTKYDINFDLVGQAKVRQTTISQTLINFIQSILFFDIYIFS